MLPKWFDDWNRDNPVNVYRPAILVGTAGGAVFVASMLIAWGQPFATESIQTGPRGTGMSVVHFASDPILADPTVEAYYTEAPFIPEPGEELAGEVYENVQVLQNVTVANFNRLMAAITEWVAPEQGCAYCHGEEGNFASEDLYTYRVARRMIQMTQYINEEWPGHVGELAGVNCYTCHRGQNVPSGIWFEVTPVLASVEGWPSVQNYVTPLSNWTSLPSDALQKYLVEGAQIRVHDLEPRVANQPGDPLIQQTERTYSLMNHFANSLDVNCTYCHNTRALYDGAQVTPQWVTASLGIGMTLDINNEFLLPLRDTYPDYRLGPLHADAPKAACLTCHKGYPLPMGGYDVISDWPELATTDVPVYVAEE